MNVLTLLTFALIQQGTVPQTPAPAKPAEKVFKVYVDTKEVMFVNGGVRTFGGRTFVPFRPLFEAIGAEVEYDLVHKRVTATKDNNEVQLTIGDLIARKNGAEITMEAAPILLKGTTYVPLRFVAESLEAKVDFDGAAGTIHITTGVD
ncbi:MAG TPA: copper amine oxidase N-terminal domain-containing protein [Fimbriimonas sp.]|nr:copper amine oxidase N-terminal domain-containing protein [Fimbriimonas sp.]